MNCLNLNKAIVRNKIQNFFLQQNPATSYNKIPNMKFAYAKVRKNDHITIDPEYERLTSSTFRYK